MPPQRPVVGVAEEIGQRRPFRSVAQEAMIGLLRTADQLRDYLSGHLTSEDITLQQYNVLRILRGAGDEGLPTLEIGERMVERHPGVTRLVDRLVAKELVARRRGTEDRRQVLCRITSDGLDLLARLDPVMDAADEVVARSLAEREVRSLVSTLDRVRAGLRDGGMAGAS